MGNDGPNRNEVMARRAFEAMYDGQQPGPHNLVAWQKLIDVVGRIIASEWDKTLGPGHVAHAYRWVAHHTINMSRMPNYETRPEPRAPGASRVP